MKDAYYSSRYVYDPARAVVWKEIVRYLSPFIGREAVVLDLGAGYCDFINQVAAKTRYAVDRSEELAKHAGPGVTAIRAEAWDLSALDDSAVDVVLASNLLEHLDDDELESTLTEVRRVLKIGGKFILLQPNFRLAWKRYFDDFTHKKIFTDVSLGGFLESRQFRIVLAKARFLPLSLRSRPSFLPPAPWLVRAYLRSPFKPLAGQMLFIAEKI